MATMVGTRPVVVHAVTSWRSCRARSEGAFEIRPLSLRMAAAMLGMNVADLDCVRDARLGACDPCHCAACVAA